MTEKKRLFWNRNILKVKALIQLHFLALNGFRDLPTSAVMEKHSMPLISHRTWQLPGGELWDRWIVEWIDQRGRHRRRVFNHYRDADRFFDELELRLKEMAAA